MNELLLIVKDQIIASFSNQFLAGGLGLLVLGWLGYVFRLVPKGLWNLFLRHCTVIVDVQSTDKAYHWLLFWLDSQAYGRRARRVSIKDVKLKDGEVKSILVPARGEHWFFYRGRPLWLTRQKDDTGSAPAGGGGSMSAVLEALSPKENISVRVVGRSRGFINDLIEEARLLYETSATDLLEVNRLQWSEWSQYLKTKRPITSVFLPPNAAGLLEDMKQFMSQQSWYREMGIPYRRGYLFYGPPGTGKSSACEAIASELGIPIYVINLAQMSDGSLESAVSGMTHTKTAMLLIEDIDTTTLKREATKDDKQPMSLGTLLNAIDGLQATDNVMLVMTANSIAGLDPALIRKGRVDRFVEFGMATEEQIAQAVARFLPDITPEQHIAIAQWPRPISCAEVQERLKQLVLGEV